MNELINDGRPAFSATFSDFEKVGKPSEGITLRDYFAANATYEEIRAIMSDSSRPVGFVQARFVQARFIHADAMIAERAKGAK